MKQFVAITLYLCLPLPIQSLTLKDIQFRPEKLSELKNNHHELMSPSIHKKLSQTYTTKNHDKTLKILKKLESQKLRPFEKAQVYQALGFVYLQKNEFKTSIDSFNKALDLKILPLSSALASMYTVSQLHMAQKDYKNGLKRLINWFHHVKNPDPSAYVLTASALFELNQKKSALIFINKALKQKASPPENWLQFAVTLNYENKNYTEASALLKVLTQRYPQKKKYWKQLVGLHFHLDQLKTALATIQMANKMGHLIKEKELLNLVHLQITEGLPYKGAKTLKHLIQNKKVKESKKHLEILAQAWIQAEEPDKALAPMEKAAQLSEDGVTAARYGHLLLELEKFELAIKTYSMSLKKGGISKEHVYLSRGIAYFHLKDYKKSLNDFKKAMDKENTKEIAQQWINYLHLEKNHASPL